MLGQNPAAVSPNGGNDNEELYFALAEIDDDLGTEMASTASLIASLTNSAVEYIRYFSRINVYSANNKGENANRPAPGGSRDPPTQHTFKCMNTIRGCTYTDPILRQVKDHETACIRTKDNEGRLICCNRIFASITDKEYIDYRKSSHPTTAKPKTQCPFVGCGKVFTRSTYLNAHLSVHYIAGAGCLLDYKTEQEDGRKRKEIRSAWNSRSDFAGHLREAHGIHAKHPDFMTVMGSWEQRSGWKVWDDSRRKD